MKTYVKIGGKEYAASITGTDMDSRWGGRQSKTIRLEMSYAQAMELFQDDVKWSIIERYEIGIQDENGMRVAGSEQHEYDNSDYCVAGDVTDHRDGTVSVKMGNLSASLSLKKTGLNRITTGRPA